MTRPLQKPPKKNPQIRTTAPAPPPTPRSRRAHGFSAAAAEGRFVLQHCSACGAFIYPAREACPTCLSMEIVWREAPPGGQLIAETTIRASTNTYFRERLPWRVGSVRMDCGVTIQAHVHGDVAAQARVRLIARTDASGQGVVMALPEQDSEHMADDRHLRELTCDPKFRRVLITDGRTELGQGMAKAMVDAGASIVFVGIAENWLPFEGRAGLEALAPVQMVALDVTDTVSVTELAGEIGGKVDILINTAEHARPGANLDRTGIATSRDEMETNYFGLLRLVQAFAPAMKARGADGDNRASAWVNILSVYALSNGLAFGAANASHAAALSLAQCLRAELCGSGVKVVNALVGPKDEVWRQLTPPPKVTAGQIATSVTEALRQGIEDLVVGPVAEDVIKRWKQDPSALAREMMHSRDEG